MANRIRGRREGEMFSEFENAEAPPPPEEKVFEESEADHGGLEEEKVLDKTKSPRKKDEAPLKQKVRSYQRFTRKGVEFILKTRVKRGGFKSIHSEPAHKKQKISPFSSGQAMWLEELVEYLVERCKNTEIPESERLVATKNPEEINLKSVNDIRNKFFLDSNGVIRTKPAFHKSKKKSKGGRDLSECVLLWPEEVRNVMMHKFRQVGKLRNTEDFLAEFWNWYQPRFKHSEINFRKDLTDFIFGLDECYKLDKREEHLVAEIKRIRKEKIEKMKLINEKASEVLGGPIESLSDNIVAVEESIIALKPNVDEDNEDDDHGHEFEEEERRERDLEDGIV